MTAFGILGALSGPLLTTNSSPDPLPILTRIPLVVLFTFLNVLVFELSNQRQPAAIIEDKVNKPFRPLARGLISPAQTRNLLLAVLPLGLGVTYFMGVWKETSLQFILAWMYNDLEGGEHWIGRNAIIAAAFGVYDEGALRIACGRGHAPTGTGFVWTAIISAVILSTMHVQEMKDQVGDLARGRRTLPIIFGDNFARWTIVVPVAFWSLFCPLYWDMSLFGWVLPIGMGFVTAVHLLRFRDPKADWTSWILWANWLSCLYMLSFLKNPAAIYGLGTGLKGTPAVSTR